MTAREFAMLHASQNPNTRDLLLDVLVVPNASRDALAGEHDRRLRIRVQAPPEAGAANKAVCSLVAEALGLRARHVTVESGHTSRRKTLRLHNADPHATRQRLESLL